MKKAVASIMLATASLLATPTLAQQTPAPTGSALGILAAAVLTGPVLAADKPAAHKPLAKMTCEDFAGLDETFQPKAVYWAAAYAKGGKPEAAVLDVDGIESAVPFIVEECQKAPKASFWEKVKAEVKKLEKKL